MRALTIVTLLCVTTAGFAADYEPTEGWPYLYDDFEPATVYYRNSAPAHANINIHLFNNTLHFIDGEDIKAASNALYIDSVVCDNNIVLEHKGKYYVERLYATPHVLVGRTCEADFSSMNKGSGAYGMGTSVSATAHRGGRQVDWILVNLLRQGSKEHSLSLRKKQAHFQGGQLYLLS